MLTGAVDTAETFRRMGAESLSGLWGIVLLSSAVNLLLFAGPLYMLQVYDRVLDSRSLETLAVLTIALALVLIAQASFDVPRFDADGEGGVAAVQNATLQGARALDTNDFVIV